MDVGTNAFNFVVVLFVASSLMLGDTEGAGVMESAGGSEMWGPVEM